MRKFYWLSLIIIALIGTVAWLWFSGIIHDQWLKYATEHNNWDRVIKLVQAGANPNIYIDYKTPLGDSLVWSPLTAALYGGRHDVVKLLLEYKADPNMAGPFGAKPIYIPAAKHDLEMVKLLFEYGADPEASDRMWHDRGPFWSYLADKDLEVLKLFVQAGANITQKEKDHYLWDTEYDRSHNPAVYQYLKNEVEKLKLK